MSDKKAEKAFTSLEMLLALSIWSSFIIIFSQFLSLFKNAHKNDDFTPLDHFFKMLSLVKKGIHFKLENNSLIFQTLDTQKEYKIFFFQKEFIEKNEIFIPIKNLSYVHWYYWDFDKKKWFLLGQKQKATSALKLELTNTDNQCFETFIFNTALPYPTINTMH